MGCSRKKKPQLSDKLLNCSCLSLRTQLHIALRKRNPDFEESWVSLEKYVRWESIHNLLVFSLKVLPKI